MNSLSLNQGSAFIKNQANNTLSKKKTITNNNKTDKKKNGKRIKNVDLVERNGRKSAGQP